MALSGPKAIGGILAATFSMLDEDSSAANGGRPRLTRELPVSVEHARTAWKLDLVRPVVMMGTARYQTDVMKRLVEMFCEASNG